MAVLYRKERVNTFQVSHVLGNVTSVELLEMLMHRLAKNGATVAVMVQVERKAVGIVGRKRMELTALDAQVI